MWYPWLQKLCREDLLCIDPHEARENADIRQIVVRTLKISKNWVAGIPTIKRRFEAAIHTDDQLQTLSGGRYILAFSPKSITCIDSLRGEKNDNIAFRYELPSELPAAIESVSYDMTDGDTVTLAVVLTYEDNMCECLFASYSHDAE